MAVMVLMAVAVGVVVAMMIGTMMVTSVVAAVVMAVVAIQSGFFGPLTRKNLLCEHPSPDNPPKRDQGVHF